MQQLQNWVSTQQLLCYYDLFSQNVRPKKNMSQQTFFHFSAALGTLHEDLHTFYICIVNSGSSKGTHNALLHFHNNSGYAKVPQCYIKNTLLILLHFLWSTYYIWAYSVYVKFGTYSLKISHHHICNNHYRWVPVTKAWHILRLQLEEQTPVWRVAANILNKQSRTAEKGWSSSLGVGRGANNASPSKNHVKKYSQGEMLPLETKQSGGKLLPHSDLRGGGGFWWKYHAASKGKGRFC
jgi:hypothetical protein